MIHSGFAKMRFFTFADILCLCVIHLYAFLFLTLIPVSAQEFGKQSNSAGVFSAAISSKATIADLPTVRAPASNILPTDVNPPPANLEKNLVAPPWRFRLFQKIPARLWFNATTEEDQRLETNVYQTHGHFRADYVFRTLPNVTVGYNVLPHGSIYCNYFVIKDLFARNNPQLGPPTTQSVSLGLRHDWDLSPRDNLQFDIQARELWIQSHIRQADLLPALNLSHVISPSCVSFFGALIQLRSNYYFQGSTREIDPFYSGGFAYRKGDWVFVASDTLDTNFRRQNALIPVGSCTMVADFELFRPVNYKLIPGLVFFMRLEPIWNWSCHKIPGQSGTDIRMYSGFRMSMTKPAYHQTMDTLRKQIMEAEEDPQSINSSTQTQSSGTSQIAQPQQSKNPKSKGNSNQNKNKKSTP